MEKVRILDQVWHLGHQYDLMKLPNVDWTWILHHRRKYSDFPRGDMMEKFNIKEVPHYEKGKYDLVILHLDQQCLEETLYEIGKGSVYREMNETITDVPKLVLMHGTPYYPERFTSDIFECDCGKIFVEFEEDRQNEIPRKCKTCRGLGEFVEEFNEKQVGCSSVLIKLAQKVIGNNHVLVNSKRAAEQWGMGTAIWHGMDKDEWFDFPKEPRVVTMISPGGLDKYYDRTFLRGVKEELEERNIYHCHITVDAMFKSWTEYRNFLGRSLIYFNPTRESCMPRSRTEAMLSGCCVITTPHQDADEFIEDGKNGFLCKRNPKEVADLVEKLIENYDDTIKVGQEGKKTAQKIFSQERYFKEWSDLIEKLTGKKIIEKSI